MSHFFAHMARMKLIHRWPLMRNIESENVAEHSQQVAMVVHLLALIKNTLFGGQLDPAQAAVLALYHDATEVITGDLPTPVKYFNPDIAKEYKKIESFAEQKLLNMLPEELKPAFEPLLDSHAIDAEYKTLVKDADTLCAYIKCLEELSAGNHEFELAKRRLEAIIAQRQTPEMAYFVERFLPSFELTLDEISEDTQL
ncbi:MULTISPECIES: 5'-deoxynucleotidase [unclassified Motilimonas]|uniref:5'-deoxynucleotidase n=1 Tax=unclassified Motilimonas TaxID=2643697 RepID=UPI001E5D1CFF|nr:MULTISPECIES: 5'-deoxynucleotidase [unclassified Motilimonas]MCE0557608.1 5'-deoxynucleotidase [Motilimonas sp. E26]MDO6526285.1 5'-deoxynucleotidase [Motilimonas sp. 1_MG-2023]